MAQLFNVDSEIERQRRENAQNEEMRPVIIGNGYSGDPYADDQRIWVRDVGGVGAGGYNNPGAPYRVLAGVGPTPEIDKHVWIVWKSGPREWQIDMSDPAFMQQTGRSMHLENPSDPQNQFVTTNRLMPLLSKPIGDGLVNVQGYAYIYDGVYREYKGTSTVAGTHVDLVALAPATAGHRLYVLLTYNYVEFAAGNNPIETFVSTSQTGELDRTDIQECVAQMDLAISRPIWAYRVDNGWTDDDIVGHADDRDMRFWPDVPETIAGLSPLTTKGDLFTYSTLNTRLPVGTDGQVLTADSAEATGLKWDDPAVSGYVWTLADATIGEEPILSGDTVTFAGEDGLEAELIGPLTIMYRILPTGVTPDIYAYPSSVSVNAQGQIDAITAGAAPVASVGATAPIASSGGTSPTISLNDTSVAPGTYTNASLTVDQKGRLTFAGSGAAPVTSVGATAPIASSGGATPTISLNDTAVSPGSYTYGAFTVDQKGRLTAASSGIAPNAIAIFRDEKTTGTAGGTSTSTTWNARDLNTELYDPGNIVSISSNQFTPIAGDYEMLAFAPFRGGAATFALGRLRLYNVTGAASVEEGMSMLAATNTFAVAMLSCKFTANGTDAFRIDNYTSTGNATTGLGSAVSDGSPEVYTTVYLRKVA